MYDMTYMGWLHRLLKIIGLFFKRALWKRRYSAKETYNFKEPTNRSHPIAHDSFIGAKLSKRTRHTPSKHTVCDPWLLHKRFVFHSNITHDSFKCNPWRIHVYDMTHDSWLIHSCVTWLIDRCRAEQAKDSHSPPWPLCSPVDWHNGRCDMPYSDLTCLIHMWHDSCMCDFAPLLTSGPAQCRVWHASFIFDLPHPYVTCLIHTRSASSIRDMPHSYVTCLIHMCNASLVNRHKGRRDMPHPYVTCLIHLWHDLFIRDMTHSCVYGVVTLSRLLKIIGLCCRP